MYALKGIAPIINISYTLWLCKIISDKLFQIIVFGAIIVNIILYDNLQ